MTMKGSSENTTVTPKRTINHDKRNSQHIPWTALNTDWQPPTIHDNLRKYNGPAAYILQQTDL